MSIISRTSSHDSIYMLRHLMIKMGRFCRPRRYASSRVLGFTIVVPPPRRIPRGRSDYSIADFRVIPTLGRPLFSYSDTDHRNWTKKDPETTPQHLHSPNLYFGIGWLPNAGLQYWRVSKQGTAPSLSRDERPGTALQRVARSLQPPGSVSTRSLRRIDIGSTGRRRTALWTLFNPMAEWTHRSSSFPSSTYGNSISITW